MTKIGELIMKTLKSQPSRSWHIVIIFLTSCLIITVPAVGQIPALGNVVTPDSQITQIGLKILEQGGNAIDAGVAAMYALSVVYPQASGLGGGGTMLIWMNQTSKATAIDFREVTPQGTNPAIFYQDTVTFNIYTKYGYRSICVPGMVAGMSKALEQFGTMTLELIQTLMGCRIPGKGSMG